MRCLALSRVFSSAGWSVGFACSRETFQSVKALGSANIECLILEVAENVEPKVIAARWPTIDILIVDHYNRGADLERACRQFIGCIVVIDDLADRPHDCDLLVDSSAASKDVYRELVPADCRVLVGPVFAPLAPEFLRARIRALRRRDGRPVERVLVSFGQIDSQNVTGIALNALEKMRTVMIDIAIGRSAPHFEELQRRAGGRVKLHADASNMPELMCNADLAIGAGGTTAWERCCLGLPSLLVAVANNQRGIIDTVSRKRAGIDLGRVENISEDQLAATLHTVFADAAERISMAQAGSILVDGHGAERIFEALS
jgi:UDP-2,4-diacetamido-2,4,6-trideoxy-beta-L-altropyranose hydrolase